MRTGVLLFEDQEEATGRLLPVDIEIEAPEKFYICGCYTYENGKSMVVTASWHGCGECQGYGCVHCRTYKEYEVPTLPRHKFAFGFFNDQQ